MRLDRKAGLLGLGVPDLKTLFATSTGKAIQGRNASSAGNVYVSTSYMVEYTELHYFISIAYGYIGIYKWDPINLIPTDTLYRSSTSYGGWYSASGRIYYANTPNASSASTARGATLMWFGFKYPDSVVTNIFQNVAATRIAGRSSSSTGTMSYTVANQSSRGIIIATKGTIADLIDPPTDTEITVLGGSAISSSNGTTRSVTGVYAGSIIGLTKNA